MSLLSFVGLDYGSLLWMSLLCLAAAGLHAFLGEYLVPGGGFFTRAVAGLSLNAAVVTFLVAFGASLAAPFIYAMIAALTVLAVARAGRAVRALPFPVLRRAVSRGIAVGAMAAGLSTALLLIYLQEIPSGNEILFNGHQNYFSGISLEIFKADYFGRLRVFDNYPLTWSKYHFFNGSLLATLMVLLPVKNLLTFMVAKICMIVMLSAAIVENAFSPGQFRKHALLLVLVVFYAFTMLPHQLWWSIFTNAFTSVFFLVLTFVFLHRKDAATAVFFALCFSLSTSRSLIPGMFVVASIFLAGDVVGAKASGLRDSVRALPRAVYSWYSGRRIPDLVVLAVFGLAIASTVLFGEAASRPFSFGLRNLHNDGWLALMSPGITPSDDAARASAVAILKPSRVWFAFWVVAMFSLVLLKDGIGDATDRVASLRAKFLAQDRRRQVELALLAIVFVGAFLVGYRFRLIVLYFMIPWTLAVVLAPLSIRRYVKVFCAASFLEIVLFRGEISIPNFAVIEWLVLYGFVATLAVVKYRELPGRVVAPVALAILLLVQGLPLNPANLFGPDPLDTATKPVTIPATGLPDPDNRKQDLYCFASDGNASLAALAGHRVAYSAEKSDRYSMSIHFGVVTAAGLDFVSRTCPGK